MVAAPHTGGPEECGRHRALAGAHRAAESRVAALQAEIQAIVDGSADANADDEHDPEGATVAFERARTAALLDDARTGLRALERAEGRLAAGTYGICEECGGPIDPERLAARPGAAACIGCARSLPSR